MILGLFRRKSPWAEPADALYRSVLTQARQPAFFVGGGVPDTVDGRFDLVALHAFLVMHRLKGEDDSRAQDLSQALFDRLFLDMDQNLREMGVGDLSVGRKVKQMAKAFYGRVAAYDAGLEEGTAVLAEALERNLLRKAEATTEQATTLATYTERQARTLTDQSLDDLLAGRVAFGPFEAAETEGGPS